MVKTQSRLTGAMALMAAQAVVLVLGYVTHLWIGRVLGPSPYGIYGVVLSLQTIFGLLLTLGVPVAISRYVAQDQKHSQSILRQGIRFQLLIGVGVGLLVLTASPLLARALGDQSLAPLIAFMAAVIFSQSLYPVYTQFLSGMHLFNRQAALTTFYAVVKLAGALALIYTFDVYGAFAGFMIGGIAAGALGWWWTRSRQNSEPKPLPVKSFLAFAGTYVLVLVGLQFLISLDLFMVKALLGDDAQAGYYNAAVTLSRIPYLLLQSLGFVLLPSVAKLTASPETRAEGVVFISDALRYLIVLIVPSVALAAATSKSLVILFYSSTFIPAAPALSILMIGLGSLAFYLLLANITAGAGQPRVSLLVTMGLVVVSSILGWWLIPQYGLIGAAWQTTITGVIGLLVLSSYTFKRFGIPIPWRSTGKVILASVIAVAPTYWWEAHSFTLPLQYIAVGLVYLAALVLLGEVTASDRRRVAGIHTALRWVAPKGR